MNPVKVTGHSALEPCVAGCWARARAKSTNSLRGPPPRPEAHGSRCTKPANGLRKHTRSAVGHGHKAEERERLLGCSACVLTCVCMRVRGRCERPGRGAWAAHSYEEKPISTRTKRMSKNSKSDAENEVDLAPLWPVRMSTPDLLHVSAHTHYCRGVVAAICCAVL